MHAQLGYTMGRYPLDCGKDGAWFLLMCPDWIALEAKLKARTLYRFRACEFRSHESVGFRRAKSEHVQYAGTYFTEWIWGSVTTSSDFW